MESILYRFHNVRLPNCYRLPWTQTQTDLEYFFKSLHIVFLPQLPLSYEHRGQKSQGLSLEWAEVQTDQGAGWNIYPTFMQTTLSRQAGDH